MVHPPSSPHEVTNCGIPRTVLVNFFLSLFDFAYCLPAKMEKQLVPPVIGQSVSQSVSWWVGYLEELA